MVPWYSQFGTELMKIGLNKVTVKLISTITFVLAQGNFNLEDLNPSSESFGQLVGPDNYLEDIVIVYFGHEY